MWAPPSRCRSRPDHRAQRVRSGRPVNRASTDRPGQLAPLARPVRLERRARPVRLAARAHPGPRVRLGTQGRLGPRERQASRVVRGRRGGAVPSGPRAWRDHRVRLGSHAPSGSPPRTFRSSRRRARRSPCSHASNSPRPGMAVALLKHPSRPTPAAGPPGRPTRWRCGRQPAAAGPGGGHRNTPDLPLSYYRQRV